MLKFKKALFENEDFVLFDKPSGFNTHAQDREHPGFIEVAQQFLLGSASSYKLRVVHRLDRGTSGLLLAACNDSATRSFFELFKNHKIKKTYLFLTSHSAPFKRATVRGLIPSSAQNSSSPSLRLSSNLATSKSYELLNPKIYFSENNFESETNSENGLASDLGENESLTHFEWVQSVGAFQLWRAHPKTGRPHQIRLHAKQLKMPILGDPLYGGEIYFRLMLHAESLEFLLQGKKYDFHCPFLEVEKVVLKGAAATALQFGEINRARILNWEESDGFRISHEELPDLQIDRYGKVDWYYWYGKDTLLKPELAQLAEYYAKLNRTYFVRKMTNRGGLKENEELWNTPGAPNSWIAEENGVKYILKADQGLSPGLFLDQRPQRQWVLINSKNKRVLNLFSYTCGFSVCAALSGAKSVVSVDVSRKLLDWGKENFKCNGLNFDDTEKYEFFAQDVLLFIKGAMKRKMEYDLVICDPPSFGRSKEGVWSLQKDLSPLLNSLSQLLAVGGRVLLTCNYEGWSRSEFENYVKKSCQGTKLKIEKSVRSGFDFEASQSETLLKGLWLVVSS